MRLARLALAAPFLAVGMVLFVIGSAVLALGASIGGKAGARG